MVTITKQKNYRIAQDGTKHFWAEGSCLSTDTKPTSWDNGSIMMEIDTSTVYFFDEAGKRWLPWS